MDQREEPWHELLFICPECSATFRPHAMSLRTRLCPDCEENVRRRSKRSKRILGSSEEARSSEEIPWKHGSEIKNGAVCPRA
jgi:hypothetical protein